MTFTIRNLNNDIISNINEMVGNKNEKKLFNLILDELMILYYFNNKNFKLKLSFNKKEITFNEYMLKLYTTLFDDNINRNDVVAFKKKYKEINYFQIFIECWILEIHRIDWNIIMPFDKDTYYPIRETENLLNGIQLLFSGSFLSVRNTDIIRDTYANMLIPRVKLIIKEIIDFSSGNSDFITKENIKIKELEKNPIDPNDDDYDSDTDTISSREFRIKEFNTIFKTMLNLKFD